MVGGYKYVFYDIYKYGHRRKLSVGLKVVTNVLKARLEMCINKLSWCVHACLHSNALTDKKGASTSTPLYELVVWVFEYGVC